MKFIPISKTTEYRISRYSYFIIYSMNNGVYTYGGKPEEIFKHLYEQNEEYLKVLKNDK